MSDIRRSAAWLADKLAEQDRRLNLVESRKPGLAQSSIEDGAIDEFTADGTFASSVGKQPDGSHVAFPATGPTPATPVKATLKSTPGLVEVRWSGKFEDDDVSTLDFKHVAVHASNTPDVDISPAAQLATIRGELGDVASIVAEEGMLYVVLVAWTAAGKASEPSQVAAVAVAAPADANFIQEALTDLDTKYDGVVTETGQLGGRLDTAETDLIDHETRLQDADQQLTDAFGQLNTVDTRVATAKQAAIDAATAAAAADATAKKEQAEANAAAAAAIDAQARADAAQQAAEAAAATYAEAQASGASAEALAAAKADATTKADAAKAAAITAAAADATAKKEQAEANAAVDAKAKADAALASAKTYADTQAEAAKFAAISAMGFSRNPSFDDWTGALPVGFAVYGTGPTKETSLVRRGTYAARFNCTDTTTSRGLNLAGGALYDLPAGVEYWTVELSFQLVSGTTLAGVGILLDWAGMTGNRTVLSLAAEIPAPVTGKWYTVTKTLQRPTAAAGTNTGMAGYLMANYGSGLGGMAVKDVVIDWINVRPATAEEINAGLALTMAGSKSRVYYNTSPAPATGGTATADGDMWKQRDASNNIIAEWRWNGTPPAGSWVKTAISSEAISNLDVGKLTAGAADMLQATIDKLVAATAAFQQVDVKNLFVTSGTMDQAVIDKLWADVVHAYKITTQMLAVSDPTNFAPSLAESADDWDLSGGMQNVGTSVDPSGRRFDVTNYSGTSWALGPYVAVKPGDKLYGKVGVYRNGSTSTAYLRYYWYDKDKAGLASPNQYASASNSSGNFMDLTATVPSGAAYVRYTLAVLAVSSGQNIGLHSFEGRRMSGGELIVDGAITAEKLQALLVLASEIIAGNPNGTHAKMGPNGYEVLALQPGGTAPATVIRMGSDQDDYFGVLNAAGESVASISSTGDMTAKTVSATDDIIVGGTGVSERLDYMPQRLVAWGQVPIDTTAMYLNPTGTEIGLFELGWDSTQPDGRDGRMYRFSTDPLLIKSSTTGQVGLRLRFTTDGSAPTVNSQTIQYSYGYVGVANGYTSVSLNRLIGSSNGNYIRVLVTLWSASGGTVSVLKDSNQTSILSSVIDLGGSTSPTAVASGGGGTNGGAAPAPPSNPTVSTTKEWAATGIRSFVGSGGTYSYNTGYMYSGLSPAGYGDLSSMAVFPSLTSTLAGATVTGVWVYVYYDFWYYGAGGDAYIGLHGQTGLTSTAPAKTYSHAVSAGWPRAAGRWIKMSSSTYAGWASGQHRGFTLGGSGGGYERYGYAHNPRLRITYTK